MGKIVRYEFMGNWFDAAYIMIAFAIVFTIPLSIIRLLQCLVRIEEEIENPTEFLQAFRRGKSSG